MPADLEDRLRATRPATPEPGPHTEARLRRGLGLSAPARGPRRWLRAPGARRSGPRIVALALLITGGTGALAASLLQRGTGSSAAPTGALPPLGWGAPESLTTPFRVFQSLDLAAGEDGRAAAVWVREGRVQARVRGAGGPWGPVATLGGGAGTIPTAPAIALDARGNAVAVWREQTGRELRQGFRLPSGAPAGVLARPSDRRWTVRVAGLRAGGAWSAPRALSRPSGSRRDAAAPALEATPGGQVLAAWGERGRLVTRSRGVGAGWAAPWAIAGPPGRVAGVDLAVAPDGRAVVAWSARPALPPRDRRIGVDDSCYTVQAATRTASGAWSPLRSLSGPLVQAPPFTVAIGEGGHAAASWTETAPPPSPIPGGRAFRLRSRALVARAAPPGAWGAAEPVGRGERFILGTALAVDGSGATTVSWTSDAEGGSARAASAARGARFSAGRRFASTGSAALVAARPGELLALVDDLRVVRLRGDRGSVPVRVGALKVGAAGRGRLEAGRDGTAVALWLDYAPITGRARVVAAVRDPERENADGDI